MTEPVMNNGNATEVDPRIVATDVLASGNDRHVSMDKWESGNSRSRSPQHSQINTSETPTLHTLRTPSSGSVASKSIRGHIELIQGEILHKNTEIIGDDITTITLTKFNKIGGHSIIYKYGKYVIKELDGENKVYDLIIRDFPKLSKYLPRYWGTVWLRIDDKRSRERERDGGSASQNGKEYIILEDLTYKMVEPFVIDLKMGTRQYGLKSSVDKVKSQKLKCKTSTSLKLGVRLCGLQTINNKGKFQLYDKYYGRQLNYQEFSNSLVQFLNNKTEFHLLIKCLIILKHLRKIHELIQELNNFRFYGSSVLMIYDNLNDFNVIIKLIDFSKSFVVSDQEFDTTGLKSSKDYGYLKGIFNLMMLFKTIFETISKLEYKENETELMEIIKNNETHYQKVWKGHIEFSGFKYEYDELVSE